MDNGRGRWYNVGFILQESHCDDQPGKGEVDLQTYNFVRASNQKF